MYSNIKILLLTLWGFFFTLNGNSQNLLSTNGKVIVNVEGDTILLRGMGLGGWMLQEGYMLQTADFASAQHQIRTKINELIGNDRTDEFYEGWLQNHVTKTDIDSLKSWGFNSVRLPLHYNLFTLAIEDEPIPSENTWLDKGFVLTDSLLSWCEQNEMYVILDLHAAPGGQGYDQAISDYDTNKPSLWESRTNRDKTVALWQKLAERYKDEEWIAGYDLLNETNWDISGNRMLADLYKEITDSIRTVDTNHIIFIEGNWFANDFTGLTPPWDDNMVYSPHKYWSFNDQASIQWVLDLRDRYNIPLYFGESGENSNVWFRDAISLFEGQNIGWAWWPMKKIESISGPLSIIKSEGYESLLNYWKGNGPTPSSEEAYGILMDLTERLKIKNCLYQKDVIDAMFRQVRSDGTLPFKELTIPGVIHSTDFDLGNNGQAYLDVDDANYNVSTSQFTPWNNGWSYRNDGVDIEKTEDQVNSNGFNVGWIEKGEWMQYDVDVTENALYDIQVRVASENSDGKFHFNIGESILTETQNIQSTGGWQSWNTIIISDVVLSTTDDKIRFIADDGGFNLGSFNFLKRGSTQSVNTLFSDANTLDENTIALHLNKPIKELSTSKNDFKIEVAGDRVEIIDFFINPTNTRIIYFDLNRTLNFDDVIRISYSGTDTKANDDTFLKSFQQEIVKNTLPAVYPIPGKIEAEDFIEQSGTQLESTTDIDGGDNIGFLDPDDYLDYQVNVERAGKYNVNYRVASEQSIGQCQLSFIDVDGNETILSKVRIPATNGWQTWQTVVTEEDLPLGNHTLRLTIIEGQFNLNWIEFIESEPPANDDPIGIFITPNIVMNELPITINFSTPHQVSVRIFDTNGRYVLYSDYGFVQSLNESISLNGIAAGLYFFEAELENGTVYKLSFVKI